VNSLTEPVGECWFKAHDRAHNLSNPDFLWSLVGSAKLMRLSLAEGAQVAVSSWVQEMRSVPRLHACVGV
jgi:hypothetical protein